MADQEQPADKSAAPVQKEDKVPTEGRAESSAVAAEAAEGSIAESAEARPDGKGVTQAPARAEDRDLYGYQGRLDRPAAPRAQPRAQEPFYGREFYSREPKYGYPPARDGYPPERDDYPPARDGYRHARDGYQDDYPPRSRPYYPERSGQDYYRHHDYQRDDYADYRRSDYADPRRHDYAEDRRHDYAYERRRDDYAPYRDWDREPSRERDIERDPYARRAPQRHMDPHHMEPHRGQRAYGADGADYPEAWGAGAVTAPPPAPQQRQPAALPAAKPEAKTEELKSQERKVEDISTSEFYVEGKTKPPCVDLFLTHNYRSQANILAAAFDVISENKDVVRRPLIPKRKDIDLSQMVSLVDPNNEALMSTRAKNQIIETFKERGVLQHVSNRRKHLVETQSGLRLTTAKDDGEFFKEVPPLSTMKPVVVHVQSVELEANFVVRTIQDLQMLDAQASIAILYRSHYAVGKIEEALLREEIPYRVVGAVSFFERKEIQDALAYMRLRINPDDDMALRRVINVPSRKFGAKRMELLESLARRDRCSLFQALLRNSDNEMLYKRTKINGFVQWLLEQSTEPLGNAAQDFELVMAKSGYEEWLKIQGEDERLDHLAELKQHVISYVSNQGEAVNLADFLYSVALLTEADDVNSGRREVQLMTVHSSKGLEFDYVFIVSVNEAIFPSRKSISSNNIEEERRLMYVAMTRARKQLIITEAGGCVYMYLPGTLLHGQSPTIKLERKPSRFLNEILPHHYAELGAHILEQKEQKESRNNFTKSADTLRGVYQDAKRQLQQKQAGGDDQEVFDYGQPPGFKYPVGTVVKHSVFGEGRIEGCNEVEGEYEIFFTQINRKRNITAMIGNRNFKLVRLPDGSDGTGGASGAGDAEPSQESKSGLPSATGGAVDINASEQAQLPSQQSKQQPERAGAAEPTEPSSDGEDYYTADNLPELPPGFDDLDEDVFCLVDPNEHD